jgi:hypothetical protein
MFQRFIVTVDHDCKSTTFSRLSCSVVYGPVATATRLKNNRQSIKKSKQRYNKTIILRSKKLKLSHYTQQRRMGVEEI